MAPINQALAAKGWRLTHILNTHHHFDHAGGNEELKAQWNCQVVGAAIDAERIPGIDVALADGDTLTLGSKQARIIEVPGILLDTLPIFCGGRSGLVGDTPFALGCGRLFEGTPEQMSESLGKIMALPDATTVYCAHEYTEANAAFAVTMSRTIQRCNNG